MKVDVEALDVAHVARAGHLRGLYHARARAPAHLRTERWPLIAVELDHAQADLLAERDDLLQRGVDEHPAQLDAAAKRRGDALCFGGRAAPGAAVVEDHPERPRAEIACELRVCEVRDATDLHPRG